MRLKDLGEFNFIERILERTNLSRGVVKGIGDDAAVLEYTKNKYLLFTCDMFVEDRHFYRRSGGYLAGKKALSASISDIAAMGGLPRFLLVSLGVPPALDVKYADGLYRGIRDVSKRFKVSLVGGDTVSSKNIVVNISLLGEVEKKNIVLRSGAKEGDVIFVTGSIGGAFRSKHLNFTPRLKEARFLVEKFKIHSMIDVSDGLLADLGHVLESSNKGASIYERDVPISRNAKDFNSAIKDGEDFELVFTLSKKEESRLVKTWPFRTRLSKIGKLLRKKGIYIIRKDGGKEKVRVSGYTHF